MKQAGAEPGWDKISYFVGANTFRRDKRRPKKRNLGISSYDKKFLTVA